MSKGLDGSSLPALLTKTHFSLLGWLHSLSVALLGKHPIANTTQTVLGAQRILGFTFTASGNGVSGPPCRTP